MLNKLELKIWSEPSLFPVPWVGTVFHFLKTLFKKSIQKWTKEKLFVILEKEDDYISVSDITGQFSKS